MHLQTKTASKNNILSESYRLEQRGTVMAIIIFL